MSEARTVTARDFWRVRGERAVGMTIVAAADADGPAGLIALSATHAAAEPPTMLVSVDSRTSALPTILEAGHFAISYLPRTAEPLAQDFAGRTAAKGADRFRPGAWTTLATGTPVHVQALGAFDGKIERTLELHGVTLNFGRMVAARARGEDEPLIYFRGSYRS